MRISEKKEAALYSAIASAVMDARVKLRRLGVSDDADAIVSRIESVAWFRVKQALNLTTPTARPGAEA